MVQKCCLCVEPFTFVFSLVCSAVFACAGFTHSLIQCIMTVLSLEKCDLYGYQTTNTSIVLVISLIFPGELAKILDSGS